jgi:eukaryotic-like serine/threonine-protein kinase
MTTSPDSSDRAWTERTGVLVTAGDPWEALALLGRVREPHLASLVRVSPVPDAVALTHRVPAGSVELSSLRSAAPLRAGHVVAAALAVIDALAALHDAGLAHGDVRAEHVLVAPDGEVVLGGAGLAWRLTPGERGGPRLADDVDAVGELVRDLLGDGGGASALVIASLRASDPDPDARPTATELREIVARSARPASLLDLLWAPEGGLRIDPRTPPAPVEVEAVPAPGRPVVARTSAPGPTPDAAGPTPGAAGPTRFSALPARDAPRRRAAARRRSPTGLFVGLAALVGAALLLAGLGRSLRGAEAATGSEPGERATAASATVSTTAAPSGSGSATRSGSAAPTLSTAPSEVAAPTIDGDPSVGAGVDLDRASTPVDWISVVDALDARRARALAAGSLTALADAVDPNGAAWAADAVLARRIASSHAVVRGGGLAITDLRVVSADDGAAVLLVRDRRDAYTVTADGRTSQVAARAPRWWRLRLAHATAGWLIEEVTGVGDTDVPGTGSAVSTPRGP